MNIHPFSRSSHSRASIERDRRGKASMASFASLSCLLLMAASSVSCSKQRSTVVEGVFADGLGMPEGPVLLDDGSWLVVEMSSDRGCVTRITKDGKEIEIIAKTGRPNGLTIDESGNIWVAESLKPSILRLTLSGEVEEFLTGCDGEPFIFPNDLCFGPDGALYMVDSGIYVDDFAPDGVVSEDYLSLDYDGRLYRIDVESQTCEKLASGLKFTNGIAFGPDGHLYISETINGKVSRLPFENGRIAGPLEPFGQSIPSDAPEGFKGPDGMAFGMNGKLYCTLVGLGEVMVLDSQGQISDRIKVGGPAPTNVAFGPEGTNTIYVTHYSKGTLGVFKVDTDGYPLFR